MSSLFRIKYLLSLFAVGLTALAIYFWWPQQNQITHGDHHHESVKGYYTCPMHPHVKEDQPGSCPVCHMPLSKGSGKAASSTDAEEKKIKFYRHPMNPEITSDVPAKDDMGMDYIPVYESELGAEVQILGRADVSLNQVQVQQMNVKLLRPEKRKDVYKIHAAGRALNASSVSLQIFEADLHQIHIGQKVQVQSPIFNERKMEGAIHSIDSFLDPLTRTAQAQVKLLQPMGLKQEASVEGTILVELEESIFIPDSAIFHTGQSDLVFVYTDKKTFLPRSVKLGAKVGRDYQIVSGLKETEKVALGPNFLIDSEARIRGAHD